MNNLRSSRVNTVLKSSGKISKQDISNRVVSVASLIEVLLNLTQYSFCKFWSLGIRMKKDMFLKRV